MNKSTPSQPSSHSLLEQVKKPFDCSKLPLDDHMRKIIQTRSELSRKAVAELWPESKGSELEFLQKDAKEALREANEIAAKEGRPQVPIRD